ncbi:MAG: exodeoxyribonuclease VII large subunit [Chromatiales bacterium]|nr:exodeoxyribonuclease VII large subunit [Chromatiales bacterium]
MQPEIEQKYIYTVTNLNHEIREILRQSFTSIWVEGEISNLMRAASGHLYFTIKDHNSQIRCAMFRRDNRQLKFELENGMLVQLQAYPELYEQRGELQLIVKCVEHAGDGKLQLEFERLKAKLHKEGLFDAALKKEIPRYPLTVGVITSEKGAALRDVISVLAKRFPLIELIVYPTLVQGAQAAVDIRRALETAEQHCEVEVLLLVRGGGSIEDLWAFNDEALARAIVACRLPIVSGIGHEIDFTIADFVCDNRAPTPSAAAEYISPDKDELMQELNTIAKALRTEITRTLKQKSEYITLLETKLAKSHPKHQLQNRAQQLDEIHHRLTAAIKNYLYSHQQQLQNYHNLLLSNTPLKHIAQCSDKLQLHSKALHNASQSALEQSKHNLELIASKLRTLSPMTTLERGYAVVSDQSNRLLRSVKQVKAKQTINIRVADGKFLARVSNTKD